jgi:hypothetical protein
MFDTLAESIPDRLLGSKIFNLGYSRAFPGGGRELWNRKSHVTHALQIVPIMFAISFLAF